MQERYPDICNESLKPDTYKELGRVVDGLCGSGSRDELYIAQRGAGDWHNAIDDIPQAAAGHEPTRSARATFIQRVDELHKAKLIGSFMTKPFPVIMLLFGLVSSFALLAARPSVVKCSDSGHLKCLRFPSGRDSSMLRAGLSTWSIVTRVILPTFAYRLPWSWVLIEEGKKVSQPH